MAAPLNPNEVQLEAAKQKDRKPPNIPDFVLECVNTLLVTNYVCSDDQEGARITKNGLMALIKTKPGYDPTTFSEENLEFEDMYREKGWIVSKYLCPVGYKPNCFWIFEVKNFHE